LIEEAKPDVADMPKEAIHPATYRRRGLLASRWNKVPAALSTPLPLTHEGFWGFFLSLFIVKCSYAL